MSNEEYSDVERLVTTSQLPPEVRDRILTIVNGSGLSGEKKIDVVKELIAHFDVGLAAGRLYFLLEDLPKVQGAFWGAYGVSKHALSALVSQLHAELKSSSIQVLGINPGPMSTPLRSRAYHSEPPDAQAAPSVAAGLIMQYLEGKREPEAEMITLQAN